MLISTCCGAPARCGSEDVGICPDCREHTEFIDTEEGCERCMGEGTIEKNIQQDGFPEIDVEIVCPECNGAGIKVTP